MRLCRRNTMLFRPVYGLSPSFSSSLYQHRLELLTVQGGHGRVVVFVKSATMEFGFLKQSSCRIGIR